MIFDNTCRSLDFLSSQNEKWEFFRQITADTLIWLAAVGRLLTTEIHTALVWRKKHSYLTRVYAQTHYGRSVPILCTNYEALFDFDVAGTSLEKLFDEISKLENLKYYVIFCFDFFFNVQNWDNQEGRDSCLKIKHNGINPLADRERS